MPKIIGIDPSITSTGICSIIHHNDDVKVSGHKTANPNLSPREYEDRFHRYRELIGKIGAFVDDHSPQLICMEAYSYASYGRSTLTLSEFGGLLRYFLIRREYPLIEVAPSRLKRFILKGNSSKEDIHNRMKQHFDIFSAITQEDILDSCMAALFGLGVWHMGDVDKVKCLEPFDFSAVSDTIEDIKPENREGAIDQNTGYNLDIIEKKMKLCSKENEK